jgi:hypothetical protein
LEDDNDETSKLSAGAVKHFHFFMFNDKLGGLVWASAVRSCSPHAGTAERLRRKAETKMRIE